MPSASIVKLTSTLVAAARRRRAGRRARTGRAAGCATRARARPGRSRSRRTSGCPRWSRTPSCARVGMLVFAAITTDIRSPATLTPMSCGVTSSSTTSCSSPPMMPECTAAPIATISSGLTPLLGRLAEDPRPRAPAPPASASCRRRAAPDRCRPACSARRRAPCWHGASSRSSSVLARALELAALELAHQVHRARSAPAAMNGRLTSVVIADDSSIFARSAASLSRCSATESLAQVDAVLGRGTRRRAGR